MKTASTVLGIVGGSIAILAAIIVLLVGVVFIDSAFDIVEKHISDYDSVYEEDGELYCRDSGDLIGHIDSDGTIVYNHNGGESWRDWTAFGIGIARTVIIVISVVMFIGGVLGIVGGAISRRSSTSGGIMMLIAAFLSGAGFPFLLTGGILALVASHQEAATA